MAVPIPPRQAARAELSASALAKCLIVLVALYCAGAASRPVSAQTVLINPITVTSSNFIYGNLSFAITGCNFIFAGGSTSCGSDGSELIGVFSGRGGTEIELLPTAGSYLQSAGTANTSLSFNMTVSDLSKSRGISSVSNILAASVNNAADNALVYSKLSGFNVTSSTATSFVGSLTSTASFALTQNPVSFNVTIHLDTLSARLGDTLTLANVKLLFQPAPEPASIAVLLTGLGGLAMIRRRMAGRARGKSLEPL
jgi:hypothetical protein